MTKQPGDIFKDNYIELMLGEFNDIRKNYKIAPLILSFSLIEATARLSAPDEKVGSKNRFIWWIEEFLKKINSLYSSADLWGARCGLLHEYGPESDLSRKGECRMISWAQGLPSFHNNQVNDKIIILCQETFFGDINEAIIKMLEQMKTDIELNKRFTKRLPYIFGHMKFVEK